MARALGGAGWRVLWGSVFVLVGAVESLTHMGWPRGLLGDRASSGQRLLERAAVSPLARGRGWFSDRAHAHNDYEHQHPLWDALERGFVSLEADVWQMGSELWVAHVPWELSPERTLERMYLEPLAALVADGVDGPAVGFPRLQLLIDLKSPSGTTYEALERILERYQPMLTRFEAGRIHRGPVTVVVSGGPPIEVLGAQAVRFAACDGQLSNPAPEHTSLLVPMVSGRWSDFFTWEGDGGMPVTERRSLRELVRRAHEGGHQVRFWATPERQGVWEELCLAGVDWIGTDELSALSDFLQSHPCAAVGRGLPHQARPLQALLGVSGEHSSARLLPAPSEPSLAPSSPPRLLLTQ